MRPLAVGRAALHWAAMESEQPGATVFDGEDDAILPLADTRAHWSLFLPAAAVALVYGLTMVLLGATGKGQGELARLVQLVFVLAPPLLLAHAFLRYYSTGLAVTEEHVLTARGWPRRMGEQVALADVTAIEIVSTRLQRRLGAGRVRLTLKDGGRITVNDLARPEPVVEAIARRIGKRRRRP